MSTKNSYDTKNLVKDTKALINNVRLVVEKAVAETINKTVSEEAFLMTFDEAEVVPYSTEKSGTIVVSVNDTDPIALAEVTDDVADTALSMLKTNVTEGIKRVLK